MAKEKELTVNDVISELEKKWGKGIIVDRSVVEVKDSLTSGNIAIDYVLGGGYPKGRIIEVIGKESSSKTSLALHAVAEAQKEGIVTAYLDSENSLDPTYAEALGVDFEKMYLSQPDYGEQALEIVNTMVESGKFGLIVVDSVSALVPKAELEGDMGQAHMGLQARLMSQALRKLTGVINKSKCIVIFINQYRQTIGGYGPTNVGSGGNALKFYASIRIETARLKTNENKEEAYSNDIRIKVIKNKVAPPYRKATVEIEFGKGYNNTGSLVDLAEKYGYVNKGGAWYTYKGQKYQGKKSIIEFLNNNQEDYKYLEEKVKQDMFPKTEPKRKIVNEEVLAEE